MNPVLSICIVTYQARDYLEECLSSLYGYASSNSLEVIVVDNGSQDGTLEMLTNEYPEVHIIANKMNTGYTRPMNQALRVGVGEFLVQLNPDTHVLPGAMDAMVTFMRSNNKVGICGPKVLNRDGSFQQNCRRGDPRPWAMICYFLGLNKLFPKSKLFGGYLLNYLGEDESTIVENVSGSCMMIRRELIKQIGYLDEDFFAYQEDTDLCWRAREAGWQVYFLPEAHIIHYGGQGGSRVEPFRSIIEWHRSYWIYYRKHLAKDYLFLLNWLYYLLMLLKLGLSLSVNYLRKERYAGPKR